MWCNFTPGLIWFFCPFICNSLSYNSEQDSESWLANRSVLMACNAPFSVFFAHWWHLFSSAMFYKNSQSFFNFTLIYNVIKLTFEILIFSFAYVAIWKWKYISKLFAVGTVVVQIEIVAFAKQSTRLRLNVQRFRNFLFLLSSRDGKRPDTRDRRK